MVTIFSFGFLISSARGFYFYVFIFFFLCQLNDFGFNGLCDASHSKSRQIFRTKIVRIAYKNAPWNDRKRIDIGEV